MPLSPARLLENAAVAALTLALGAFVLGCGSGARGHGNVAAAPAGSAMVPVQVGAITSGLSGLGQPLPPRVTGVAAPLGSPPAAVPEPAAIDRSSPASLLAALAAAVDRGDAASLARVRASRAMKPTLDQHDVDRATLDFLSHGVDQHWKRLVAAADPAAVAAISAPVGTSATLPVTLGGALGTASLTFRHVVDGWVLP